MYKKSNILLLINELETLHTPQYFPKELTKNKMNNSDL
jgi:hypothetical protein